ncbi:hypothetical protein GCM10007978_01360 [Shewanella hanedai]|uniref:Laminin G domain-containing protein n=1 Tax=Shewanella hanedai TaxID=25 RepID=A0A553JUZ6_SHEHA|nr:LamG-like jellyroll fold domain-containing protein [Shewanella hanedai]TRY16250.1 hypothetical protein FN961_01060 [Shewanella hanedai]GGI67472.1 hypothetical protein GCM10007978_01360 [Shewanella hanedai]
MKRIIHSLATLAVLGLCTTHATASNWDAHWSFAGHGNDSFHHEHNGVFPLSGTGSFEIGKQNQALYYDLLQIDSLSIQKSTDPFSLSLWGLRETNYYSETLFSKQASAYSSGMSVELDDNNSIVVDIRNGQGGSIKVRSIAAWDDMNDWHHLVVTYNGSIQANGISLYLDNQLLELDIVNDNLSGDIASNEPMVVGADSANSFSTFNGAIDEVYLGSRAYNSSDIECLFALRDNCVVPDTGEPPVVAPQGPRGFEGPTGPQGLRGATGTQGVIGQRGAVGDTGIRGPQGVVGSTGAIGLRGLTGISGNPGVDGRDGRDGRDGNTGLVGITGPDGLAGSKGVRGDTGSVGPQGDPGPQGLKGATGVRGDTGATGDAGPQGYSGAAGVTGADGVQGDKGSTGALGATGPVGPRGYVGPAGYKGPTGYHGVVTNGSSGAEGARGGRGPIGYSRYFSGGGGGGCNYCAKGMSTVQLYKTTKARQTVQDGVAK